MLTATPSKSAPPVKGFVGGRNAAAYCASKGGVRLFTKSVAIECGRAGYGIRVNSVHPGNTDTPMFRQERDDMRRKGVAHVLRASPHYVNTAEELARFVGALAGLL